MADVQERLSALEGIVGEVREDLVVLRQLVAYDHASALNKMRYVTEKLLMRLCQANSVSWGKAEPTLERMIGPLVAKGVIPKDVAILVRTVQANASPGSHYQERALGQTHVQIAQMALLEFLEWYASQGGAILPTETTSHAPEMQTTAPSHPWGSFALGSACAGIPTWPLLWLVAAQQNGVLDGVKPLFVLWSALAGIGAIALGAFGLAKRVQPAVSALAAALGVSLLAVATFQLS